MADDSPLIEGAESHIYIFIGFFLDDVLIFFLDFFL